MKNEGLADAKAASPFRLPRLHPGNWFGFPVRLTSRDCATADIEAIIGWSSRRKEQAERADSGHETAPDLPKYEALWRHFSSR